MELYIGPGKKTLTWLYRGRLLHLEVNVKIVLETAVIVICASVIGDTYISVDLVGNTSARLAQSVERETLSFHVLIRLD